MELRISGEVVMSVTSHASQKTVSRSTIWLAGILVVVPIAWILVDLHGIPTAIASPAPSPGAPPSTAGITVVGIASGRVRVAVLEMDGKSFVVGVGDRVRNFTVKAIAENAVVLERGELTFRLPLTRGSASPTAAGAAPPAVASPAAAVPAASAATSVAAPLTFAPAIAQPPTVPVRSVESGPTGYKQPAAIPVLVVVLPPESPIPSAIPPGTTLYTPSGTSVYGFATAPITPQSTVTVGGVSVLPIASNQVQTNAQLLPPGTTLYTPSGTSLYGISTRPTTMESIVTLRGATGLPVASNQAQSISQVLPRPTYRVELAPISDQPRVIAIAVRMAQAGFVAQVEAPSPGLYTVKLIPPPQSTVGEGIAAIRAVGTDLPIKIELVR